MAYVEAYRNSGAKYPLACPSNASRGCKATGQRPLFALPFDLFAEEVEPLFRRCNLQRWDLMRTFEGLAAPNNPTDGEIAAEYFGIPPTSAAFDEKRLILRCEPTEPASRRSGVRAAMRAGYASERRPTSRRSCARPASSTTSCWRCSTFRSSTQRRHHHPAPRYLLRHR